MSPPPPAERSATVGGAVRQFFGVYRYSIRALGLVWTTSRPLSMWLGILSLVAGVMPAGIAYVGKLIVDAVVAAAASGATDDQWQVGVYVFVEAGLVALLAGVQQGIEMCRSLLRALLGNRTNVLVLEKALTLELAQFENSEFYDKMTRARREASTRPLGLVMRTFGLMQNGISLVSYGAMLLAFSGWAVLALALASVPAFVAETRFSGEAFRLFRWRTPEAREQMYLETVIAREDFAKEVKLFGLGRRLVDRYIAIFVRLFREERSLIVRRGTWVFALGLLGTAAFYGAYVWIAFAAATRVISLGEMTMYVLVFKQSQAALSASLSAVGRMYEDNLYLSNLYEFLDEEIPAEIGHADSGPQPGTGLTFEDVSFSYPGSQELALRNVSFEIRPGQKLALVGENGAGKTTLIKLLTRLYAPTTGRITLDGRDLREWSLDALRKRVGVIFQDFVRYQFIVGENIGVGDVSAFEDEERWREAADKGLAAPFIEDLPGGYQTQLGRWFKGGRELSLGQWQKIALSRAFMRRDADIIVLDEPTASMDAEAEVKIFEHFRAVTANQMAIVISHRFSTVRMADRIIVLDGGGIVEDGTHDELVAADGIYARLFSLQAQGYM